MLSILKAYINGQKSFQNTATIFQDSSQDFKKVFFFAVSREATPRKEESFLMQLDANTHFTHLHILMNCIFDYKEECISLKKVESHYAFLGED